ncbi:MAG: hypothetical protein WD187_00610 [Candidatus Woykebacteria bacterium]
MGFRKLRRIYLLIATSAFVTFLLFIGLISIEIYLATFFVSVVIYSIDKLEVIKTLSFEARFRKIRDEIYAKAEELERLEKRVVKSEEEINNRKIELQQLMRQLVSLIPTILLINATTGKPSKTLETNFKIQLSVLLENAFDNPKERDEFAKKITKLIGTG